MSKSEKTVVTGEVVFDKNSSTEHKNPKNVDSLNNETIAALGYVFFLIPLVFSPKSAFARFHANQGLLLQIYTIVIIVIAQIPFLGIVIGFFGFLLSILLFVFGIFQANSGNKIRLPIIGSYDIIK